MDKKNKYTQLEVLQNFEFAKTPVMAGIVHTGEMIALRPCVENLGLNWSGQLQAIKRNPKLEKLCASVKAYGADGKKYDMVCLPPGSFQDWLWSLSPLSANFNIDLWEIYKKGLVMHLLMMLKISLDKVQELQSETGYLNDIREIQKKIDTLDKNISEKSSILSELKKDRNNLQQELNHLLRSDPAQLKLNY